MRRFAPAIMGLLSLLFGCKPKESPFAKTDGVWHYRDHPIAEADVGSFVALSDHYAKDKARVYYGDTYRKPIEYYLQRHSRVTQIDGADAASFQYLDQGYARDARRVYFEGKLFPVKDPATFEILADGFTRDRLTGYYHQAPVPGSDGATFAVVGWQYTRDAKHAFYSWLEPGQPPIVHSMKIPGADPASLTALEFGYAVDSGQVYHDGKPLTKDPASFRVLQFGYAVGKDRVYYDGVPVEGADPATFAMTDHTVDSADARDARHLYMLGKRVGTKP